MKQSTGRLLGARLLSRPAALGIGMAVAVVAGISACGGSGGDSCHNVPPATTVVGQPSFNLGLANPGGASGSTLGAAQGSSAANDGTGPLYVADTANNRILGYNKIPTGIATNTYAGLTGTGQADFVLGQPDLKTTSSGTGPSGSIPYGLFFPSKVSIAIINKVPTYLLVADSANNRVLIWGPGNLPTSATTAPSIVIGQPGLSTRDSNYPPRVTSGGAGSTPTASNLSNPTAAYIGGSGDAVYLVVVDKGNNRVLIWNSVSTLTSFAPADVELGQAAISSAGVACTSNDVTKPAGFCFGTALPAADTFPTGGSTYTLGMNSPSDVWTDGANLVVSDTGNHRVLTWSNTIPTNNDQLEGNVIGFSAIGVGSQVGLSGNSGLSSPWGVGSDGVQSIFVGDTGNNRVLEFKGFFNSPQNGPKATFVWGQQDFSHVTSNDPDQNNSVGDQRNNPATNGITQGTMFNPQGVFADGSNLIVSDTGNSRVLIYPIVAPNGSLNSYGGVDGTDVDDTNYCY